MKRKALIALLALGTIGGFGSGVFSMCRHRQHHRARFEQTVTNICTNALRQAQATPATN
jgi:hypothetical protein